MRILLSLFLALFFIGCANSTPSISSKLSNPIFVQNKANSSVFIMFKNSTTNELVTDEIIAEFVKNGFRIANNKESADFIVLGDITGFERLIVKDPSIFVNMGVGSGFGRYARHGGFFGLGVEFGLDDDEYYRHTNSYNYRLNAVVLIRPKDGKEQSTTITLSQNKETYSLSHVWPHFKERLARQIVALFYQF